MNAPVALLLALVAGALLGALFFGGLWWVGGGRRHVLTASDSLAYPRGRVTARGCSTASRTTSTRGCSTASCTTSTRGRTTASCTTTARGRTTASCTTSRGSYGELLFSCGFVLRPRHPAQQFLAVSNER